MMAFSIGSSMWIAGMAVGTFIMVCGLIDDDDDDDDDDTPFSSFVTA